MWYQRTEKADHDKRIRRMNVDIIRILSEHINSKQSKMYISPETVTLAKSHQVLPIVYYQTKEESINTAYFYAISSYVQRTQLLSQIAVALRNIPFYTVKGLSVASYYPVPQLRTMGDCDIIVHECDKEKVKQILLSIGFTEQTSEWDDKEWHFQKQGMDFELHHRLLYDEAVNTAREKAFADSAWNYVQRNKLNINFHFVFLLLHLKKHLLNRGIGIRQFMDLAVMSKNAGLDRAQVSIFLQQAGIEKFAGICSALCLRWFGVALPVETSEITDEFFNQVTETILSNGVFGFEAADNGEKRLLNDISKSGKIRSIIGYILPSYKICCTTPKYKWIIGKPYLLPILWIYRIFWALFHGKSKASAEFVSLVVGSNRAMEERAKTLSDWGLYQ